MIAENQKELKKLLGFGMSVIELVADISDGIGFSIIAKLVQVAKEAKPALAGAEAALAQYKAMSDAEAVELEQFVQDELDISQDKVEAMIESILSWIIQLHGIFDGLMQKKVA